MAKLDNGEIVRYSLCSETLYPDDGLYDPELFEMIGQGVIYSFNGVRQTFTRKHYFYKNRYC